MVAKALQAVGACVLSLGIGLVSVPGGLVAAGVCLVMFGATEERG